MTQLTTVKQNPHALRTILPSCELPTPILPWLLQRVFGFKMFGGMFPRTIFLSQYPPLRPQTCTSFLFRKRIQDGTLGTYTDVVG